LGELVLKAASLLIEISKWLTILGATLREAGRFMIGVRLFLAGQPEKMATGFVLAILIKPILHLPDPTFMPASWLIRKCPRSASSFSFIPYQFQCHRADHCWFRTTGSAL
jgi:hypothetical protein